MCASQKHKPCNFIFISYLNDSLTIYINKGSITFPFKDLTHITNLSNYVNLQVRNYLLNFQARMPVSWDLYLEHCNNFLRLAYLAPSYHCSRWSEISHILLIFYPATITGILFVIHRHSIDSRWYIGKGWAGNSSSTSGHKTPGCFSW